MATNPTGTGISSLPPAAAQASRAALEAALADKSNAPPPTVNGKTEGPKAEPEKKKDDFDDLPEFEGDDEFPEIIIQPETRERFAEAQRENKNGEGMNGHAVVDDDSDADDVPEGEEEGEFVGEYDDGEMDEDQMEDGEIQDFELDVPYPPQDENRDVAGLMEEQEDRIRTVFDDPNGFNVKHPLYSQWTLWFDSPATKGRNLPPTPMTSAAQSFPPTPGGVPPTPGAGGWMDDIKKVITFDSVEEFWGLYNNIMPPSQLPQKANYYLFREGIIPAWEDSANKDGGKWSIQLPKDKNRSNVDKMWLYTMLAAIGETFDPATETTMPSPSLITGVIVSTRPQFYRISIWTRMAPASSSTSISNFDPVADAALHSRVESVGKHFKTGVLGYEEKAKLAAPLATEVEFVSHKESEKKGRGGGKKMTV